ncbi:MAG: hypothetical protein ACMV1B_11455 [Prevotella sp.]
MSAEVAQAKKNLAINYRLQKELEKDNLLNYKVLSTPESRAKKAKLTCAVKKQQTNLLENELSRSNVNEVRIMNLNHEEISVYEELKNDKMYCNKELVLDLKHNNRFKELQENKVFDMRTQRHKKTPASWIEGIAQKKVAYDVEARLKALEDYMQQDKEAKRLSQEDNQRKFEAIGLAIVNLQTGVQLQAGEQITLEDKLLFLKQLGVETKKINLYRVKEENPTLTKTQLSVVAQVTRPTVYSWLKEVDGVLSGLNKS